ncbi:MAG: phosphoribosylaminoimidazolesuccinocarboxamide synthase [bacterium]|nr:MAG: phosphoribosylaminoimidazolesuccinocarboxamide synthase [bacterium]
MSEKTQFSRSEAVIGTDFPDLSLYRRGKVRDVYDLGDHLLIVATDRISAFDCVMPNGIPDKGKILTAMSLFWFSFTEDLVENHLISTTVADYPEPAAKYGEVLEGRSMLVRKTAPFPIECVARGYIAGSGWNDYLETGRICGIDLPEGLHQAERLPETIFTPATKAESGHDENITYQEAERIVGKETAAHLRDLTILIYEKAREYAAGRGIIISDTKLEFGTTDGRIILIDEILTPDSSRFWPTEGYRTGSSPPNFDKQFVRDYLENLDWDKTPPAPALPDEIVIKTREKYLEAYRLLTGREFGG